MTENAPEPAEEIDGEYVDTPVQDDEAEEATDAPDAD